MKQGFIYLAPRSTPHITCNLVPVGSVLAKESMKNPFFFQGPGRGASFDEDLRFFRKFHCSKVFRMMSLSLPLSKNCQFRVNWRRSAVYADMLFFESQEIAMLI